MNPNRRTAWSRVIFIFLTTGMLGLSLMPRASAGNPIDMTKAVGTKSKGSDFKRVGNEMKQGELIVAGNGMGEGLGDVGQNAAQDVGQGGKDAGKGVGKGGKDVGKGGKDAGKGVGRGGKDVGKGGKDVAKGSKDVGKGVGKGGKKDVAKGFKKVL